MKIKEVIQAPFGTIIGLDQQPEKAIGMLMTTDGSVFHRIKGTSTDAPTDVLVDSTNSLKVGQSVEFVKAS